MDISDVEHFLRSTALTMGSSRTVKAVYEDFVKSVDWSRGIKDSVSHRIPAIRTALSLIRLFHTVPRLCLSPYNVRSQCQSLRSEICY